MAITEYQQIKPDPVVEVVPLGTMPGDAEWRGLCQMARVMSSSALVPASLRRKPEDVLLVLMTGRALGIDPMTALNQCYVVDGKVTIAPKLRLALLHNSGRGTIRPVETSAERCTGRVFDATGNLLEERTYTMADVPQSLSKRQNWQQYPARMLWWRLAGYLLDDHFPEVGLGIYSPDELGAITDEDGVPIDTDTVDMPPGYGAEAPAPAPPVDPLSGVRGELTAAVAGLNEQATAELRSLWTSRQLPKIGMLTEEQIVEAWTLVDIAEDMTQPEYAEGEEPF